MVPDMGAQTNSSRSKASGSQLISRPHVDPLGTRFSRNLGPILAPLLDPMLTPCWQLAPCWQLLGVLGHLGAFLERSRAYLEALLINMEYKTKGRGWIFEKPSKSQCF